MENKPQLEADGLLHFTLKEDINTKHKLREKKKKVLLYYARWILNGTELPVERWFYYTTMKRYGMIFAD